MSNGSVAVLTAKFHENLKDSSINSSLDCAANEQAYVDTLSPVVFFCVAQRSTKSCKSSPCSHAHWIKQELNSAQMAPLWTGRVGWTDQPPRERRDQRHECDKSMLQVAHFVRKNIRDRAHAIHERCQPELTTPMSIS